MFHGACRAETRVRPFGGLSLCTSLGSVLVVVALDRFVRLLSFLLVLLLDFFRLRMRGERGLGCLTLLRAILSKEIWRASSLATALNHLMSARSFFVNPRRRILTRSTTTGGSRFSTRSLMKVLDKSMSIKTSVALFSSKAVITSIMKFSTPPQGSDLFGVYLTVSISESHQVHLCDCCCLVEPFLDFPGSCVVARYGIDVTGQA